MSEKGKEDEKVIAEKCDKRECFNGLLGCCLSFLLFNDLFSNLFILFSFTYIFFHLIIFVFPYKFDHY